MQELKVFCDTDQKLGFIQRYFELPGFDFRTYPHSKEVPVEVFVVAAQLQPFKSKLKSHEIEYQVVVEDVSKVIENQLNLQKRARMYNDGISLKVFPRYDEVRLSWALF